MGSGLWRAIVVTAALALVASILPWCAVTLQAHENDEGYGPIEDQLQVNNAPIPHPMLFDQQSVGSGGQRWTSQ